MNLKFIMLSKRNHSQYVTYYMILFYVILNKYCNREQISGWHGLGMRRGFNYKGMHKADLGTNAPGLYHHFMAVTWIYTCVKFTVLYAKKKEKATLC